jgi:hypothetical protein
LVFCGASEAGVTLATEAAEGAVGTACGRNAFACTVRVNSKTATTANATDEAPAASHIRSGVFGFMLLENRRITIYLFY